MSRNARVIAGPRQILRRFGGVALLCVLLAGAMAMAAADPLPKTNTQSRVVIVQDPEATEAFKARPDRVRAMVNSGITKLTGQSSVARAWGSLVSPKDVVGIKVFSAPGADTGTRPSVVAAVVEGLLATKVRPTNIIIWDKHKSDLLRAGYDDLGEKYGVRVEGSLDAGFDEETFYSPERPILGQLVYGDVEFGRKGEGVGRRSFVSKLLSKSITKIISVAPLLNHNTAGVNGHLYSLAMGSVDNTMRFENDLFRLSTAVPEIYALPSLSDHVVLNITDALICQYQGEQRGLLHYSAAVNELRFSKDPVALDLLSLRELERTRLSSTIPIPQNTALTNQLELLHNAELLELGASDAQSIKVERLP